MSSGRKSAYELGRRAIGEHLSILDPARIHHTVLLDVLDTSRELEHIAQAASESWSRRGPSSR